MALRQSYLDPIPPEILGEIFLHCIPYPVSGQSSTLDALLLLCGVSRLWRDVAFSTPELWCSISVKYADDAFNPHPSIIRTWMERSRDLPLSFELIICCAARTSLTSIPMIDDVLQIFVSAYRRWKDVHLVLPQCIHPVLQSIPLDGAPLLENVHISVESATQLPDHLLAVFRMSPRLRTLVWQLKTLDAPFLHDTIPWSKLTDIHLDSRLDLDNCFRILYLCVNLDSCYLANVCMPTYHHRLSEVPFKHPRLRSLRIEAAVDVLPLFRSLTLPLLKSLIIEVMGAQVRYIHQPTSQELLALILRSSPPLECLVLENTQTEEEEIIHCLDILPSLVSLVINDEGFGGARITDKIILKLGKSEKGSRDGHLLCPKLEVIKFYGLVASTDGTFLQMVADRWEVASSGHASKLKSVQVEFHDGPHWADIEGIKRMRGRGLIAHAFTKWTSPAVEIGPVFDFE